MSNVRLAKQNEWSFIKENADEIYLKNEKDFWKKEYFRISKEDCLKAIEKKELYVFYKGTEICGFVTIKKASINKLTFSMLTVIEKHQRNGIGKLLLEFIIEKANKEKFKQISLEILCAKDWDHPHKEFLISWYKSYGFNYEGSFSFEKLYPSHKKYMKCDLIFKEYIKEIK